ncbi:hypothetical protein SAMN05518849_10424 [Sphingobium sp. AP50]|uniref:hypothetical protein n=1 Tax=Sphingobium sp. AP50 TaxID=1884369 RepID=UPI0008C67251|nr:hypothetical protein [Sphingobium sp. AP50]SEJ23711.1 hypothetical protein SAMN05518849_10424 [Sphingobium sp. AP50]
MMQSRTLTALLLLAGMMSASATMARKPVAEKRCVLQSRVAAPVVRDDGRLYFRGQPDRKQSYIAVFKGGACPGLNRFATAIVETTGAGYCEGDKVRALATPSQIPGPLCVIDHLMPFAGDVDDAVPDESGNK